MYSGKETEVKSCMGKQMAVKKWHLRGAEAYSQGRSKGVYCGRCGTARWRLRQGTGKAARLIASGLAYYQSEMGEFGKLDNRL